MFLTPEPSPDRQKSGMLQAPGELVGDEPRLEEGASRFGLTDLEDLLDSFVAIRPVAKMVPVDVLERLLDEFVALQSR